MLICTTPTLHPGLLPTQSSPTKAPEPQIRKAPCPGPSLLLSGATGAPTLGTQGLRNISNPEWQLNGPPRPRPILCVGSLWFPCVTAFPVPESLPRKAVFGHGSSSPLLPPPSTPPPPPHTPAAKASGDNNISLKIILGWRRAFHQETEHCRMKWHRGPTRSGLHYCISLCL